MQDKLEIVQPPANIFKNSGFPLEPAKQVVREMTTYLFDHMEYPESGGMLAWFRDCPFPAKGMPFPQAIHACNGVKRFWKRGLDALVSRNMALPLLGFLLSRKKSVIIESWLDAYADSATFILEPFFLDPIRYAECPLEIRIFLINFLTELGISQEVTKKFSEVFSTLIQYDDAYRLRVEDVMSESTKENMLKNPAKEMERILAILSDREPHQGNTDKFSKIATMLKFLFIVPKFKKSFKNAIEKSHFENFQLDDADRYHLMLREDYKAMGYTIQERVEMYKAWHSVFPPLPPRPTVKLQ